jgi:hypothetical protein
MKLTKKAQSATQAADLLRRSRAASRAGNDQQAAMMRGQAYKKLGYQPNPRAKGKAAVKAAVITTIKKADDPKEAIKDAKVEEKELREAAKSKKAEAKEAEADLKEANKDAKAEPTAENLEVKADAEAKVEAAKTEAEVLQKSADAIKEGIAEAAPAAAAKATKKATKKPKAAATAPVAEKKEPKNMTKKQKQANGHFGQFIKAKNAGDLEAQANARAALKNIGFNVQGDKLIPYVNSAPASKKAAPKKAATKAAPKKAAPKKAATTKAAPKKAAPKKAAPKKSASAGAKAAPRKGGAKKGPAFPAAAKGAKTMAKAATTTYKQGGRIVTKTVTRTYRENPMGDVGTMFTLLIFGAVGAVAGDMLDRYIATMPREGSDKALHGIEASAAIQQAINAKRGAAQGGLFVLLAGITYYLAKKNKKTPSIILGGLALGVGIRAILQSLNDHAMPAIFKTSGNAAEPSFGDRYYSDRHEAAQKDLSGILESYDATIKSRTAGNNRAATEVAGGSKLAGLSARVGGPAVRPTAQVSDRRAPAALPSPAARPAALPAALPAPTSAVGGERVPAASRVAGEIHVEHAQAGKLGCGGPGCGPSCGCNACKAAWGSPPGLLELFGPRPPATTNNGATNIPLPAGDRIENQAMQLGNVTPIRSGYSPTAPKPKRYNVVQYGGFRG